MHSSPQIVPLRNVLLAGGALLAAALVVLAATADARVLRLLQTTAGLAAATCCLALPLGTLLAALLLRSDLPGRRGLLALILVTALLPLYLQAAAWDAGLGRQGWFSLSYGSLATPVLQGWRAAAWVHSAAAIPWVVLIVSLGLYYTEADLEQWAMTEAPAARVFRQVTLPRIAPSLLVAGLWVSLSVATEITVTDLYQVRTMAEEVYLWAPHWGVEESTFPWPALMACVLAMAAGGLAVVTALAPPAEVAPAAAQPLWRAGAKRYALLAAVIALLMLLWGIPLANLIINAGMHVRVDSGHPTRLWDGGKALEMVLATPARFADEFRWTFAIGAAAASATLMISLPLAWWAVRSTTGTIAALLSAAVAMAVPGPILGLSIIWLLNRDHALAFWLYDRTIFAPVLAMTIRSLPLATLITWYALRTVGRDVLEAAACDGAGPVAQLLRVAAAQRRLALAALWLVCLALSMGELSATVLVTPPGISTLALRTFGLLHAGVDDQVAALCLTVLALFAGIGLAVAAAIGPKRRME